MAAARGETTTRRRMSPAPEAEQKQSSSSSSASYDLTAKLIPFLDRHLTLPLIDFLEDASGVQQDYNAIRLQLINLSNSNMVVLVSQWAEQAGNTDLQQECKKREEEIVATLNELEGQASVVMQTITNPAVVSSLKQDKSHNLLFLKENHGLTMSQIDVLYKLGRFQYTVGQYEAASDYLYHFRVLTLDPALELSSMWGKLVADILEGSWDPALAELDLIRKHLDNHYPVISSAAPTASSNSSTPGSNQAVQGLQQRTWFLHWSLFVYFNHPEGRDKLVDVWVSQSLLTSSPLAAVTRGDQQSYLLNFIPTIQTNAPWLLRYLAAAVILSSPRKALFKGNTYINPLARIATKEQLGHIVLQVIKQEATSKTYSDPITDFLRSLFVDCDFVRASECLKVATDQVVPNDFFLVNHKDDFLDKARALFCEAYCRIHGTIDISILSKQLGLEAEEGERWIVNLIRDARFDAKIDLKENIIRMNRYSPTAHQTVIDKTKSILERSQRIDFSQDAQQQQSSYSGRGGRSNNTSGRGGKLIGRPNGVERSDSQAKPVAPTVEPVA